MTNRGGVARTATPTALVAAAAAGKRGGGRSRRRRKAGVVPDLTAALRSAPEAVGRHLPGGRRSGLPLIGRRRRGPSLLKLARHAGTAISAVGFATDLLAEINALTEANRKAGEPGAGAAEAGRRSPDRSPQRGSRRSQHRDDGAGRGSKEAPADVSASNGTSRAIGEERK